MPQRSAHITSYGDYYLLKPLTTGGNNEQWLACKYVNRIFQNFFALKKTAKQDCSDQKPENSFLREGRAASFFRHQNIASCFDYGIVASEDCSTCYIVTEFVFGKNLLQVQRCCISKNETFPLDIVLQIILLVARGIVQLHSRCTPYTMVEEPVLHCDISPANIMISYSGEVKIIDFGIALVGNHVQPSNNVAGKLTYMSPEQASGKRIDSLSDLYSLGVVFWELLCGCKLVERELKSVEEVVASYVEPVHPSEKNSLVPRAVGDMCMKCLQYNKNERYSSVVEVCEEIKNWTKNNISDDFTSIKKYMSHLFADTYKIEVDFLTTVESSEEKDIFRLFRDSQEIRMDAGKNENMSTAPEEPTEEYTTSSNVKEQVVLADRQEIIFEQDDITRTDLGEQEDKFSKKDY